MNIPDTSKGFGLMDNDQIYIRKAQAATLSGSSLPTIDRKIKAGAFATKKDGRSVLIDRTSFLQHLNNLPTNKAGTRSKMPEFRQN